MVIRVKELVWDEYNSSHISKHAVSTYEVEQICVGKTIAWPTHTNRFLIISHTKKGRMLTIILAQKSKQLFYPISARDSSRKERGWIKLD